LYIPYFSYLLNFLGAFSGPLNYYRARFRYGQPVVSSKIIDVPTLIVWGTNDQFLETPLASLSASYCPKSAVKFIANASHWVQQEEPTIVNQHIDDFLASKKGDTGAAGSSH
jgi:pimeloyl-ACP methyl ester carboxylesterase